MALVINGITKPTNQDLGFGNETAIENIYANGILVWALQKYYYISYNNNGGSGSMEQQTIPVGVATALNRSTFSRTGYLFNGWGNSAAGGRAYTDGQTVTDIAAAGATKTLYALWDAITYYVQFNGNGNNGGSMGKQSIKYDASTALTANAFTRLNYSFSGWATSPGGAKVYNNQQTVRNLSSTNNAVINLYAIWKQIQGDKVVSTEYLQFGSTGYYPKTVIWKGIDTATYRAAKIKIPNASITQNFAGYGVIVYLGNGTDKTEVARAYREDNEGGSHNNIGYTPGMEITLNFTVTGGLVDLYVYGEEWPGKAGAGNGDMFIHTSQITLLAR